MVAVLSGPLCCAVARFDGFAGPLSFILLSPPLISSLTLLSPVCFFFLALLFGSSYFLSRSALSSLFLALTRTTAGGRDGALLRPSLNRTPPAHIGSRGWPWTLPIVPGIFGWFLGAFCSSDSSAIWGKFLGEIGVRIFVIIAREIP